MHRHISIHPQGQQDNPVTFYTYYTYTGKKIRPHSTLNFSKQWEKVFYWSRPEEVRKAKLSDEIFSQKY